MKPTKYTQLQFDLFGFEVYLTGVNSKSKTFLIMKMAAVFLIFCVFGLLYYYSDRQEYLYEEFQARREIAPAGPHSARPKAYNFQISDSDPNQTIESFKGQVVYINFWASWCEPCKDELSLIDSLSQNQFKDKIQFLLINMDSDGLIPDARDLQAKLAPNTPTRFKNTRELQKILNIEALPFHMVIDKNGNVAAAFYASLLKDKTKFIALLEQLQAE